VTRVDEHLRPGKIHWRDVERINVADKADRVIFKSTTTKYGPYKNKHTELKNRQNKVI